MLIPQAVVQQGSGLTQSYLGYNTQGASFENMDAGRAYCKTVTLAASSLISCIDAYVKGNAANVGTLACGIYSDSGSVPTNVVFFQCNSFTSFQLNTTARWVSLPCGAYLPSGTYWICVWSSNTTAASMQLAFDAGSDRFVDSDNAWLLDSSIAISTGSTANSYSIRASRFA